MTDPQRDNLQTYTAIARAVVDHLVSITTHRESEEWRARYLAIQHALAEERIEDAIRENARLGDRNMAPKWVVSRRLSELLAKALGNLAYELRLPNPGRTDIRLERLPADVAELGTVADENKRQLQAIRESFQRDPIEDDSEYEALLKEVDQIVEKRLEGHPMRGGIGFCHVVWDTKKRILKDEYNIDWRTPGEMNPHTLFD